MNLSTKVVKLLEDFLSARADLRAREPNRDRVWAATYGTRGSWETCISAIADLGATRDDAIKYMYEQQQMGRAT